MPNLYEKVLAIPDQTPAQFSGAVSYHCGLSPSKALMTLPPIVDGGTD